MRLRELFPPDEDGVVPSASEYKDQQVLEMRALFENAKARRKAGDKTAPLTVGDALVEINQGRIWSLEGKLKVGKSRRTL